MAHLMLANVRKVQDAISMAAAALRGEIDATAARVALVEASAILAAAADHTAPEELRAAASEQYGSDELEIDDDAAMSPADNGDWVAAWVWVASLDDDDDGGECRTCAEAVETRAAPCDECGALDGEA